MKDYPEPFYTQVVTAFESFDNIMAAHRKNRRANDMIYRGQAEAIWSLIPPLFRDYDSSNTNQLEWLKKKIKEEFQSVSNFVKTADSMGFSLPGDYFDLINSRYLTDDKFLNWYLRKNNKYYELIALAQHHGVPTRLIDFTTDFHVALYFAAEEVMKYLWKEKEIPSNSNRHFSVWAIDAYYFHMEECRTNLIFAPSARNKYLNAQKGLFLSSDLPDLAMWIKLEKENIDLQDIIIDNCKDIGNIGEGFRGLWPIIVRYDVPFGLAPTILRKLDDRGINLTSIRPNLDNVVKLPEMRKKVNATWSEMEKEYSMQYPEGFL